MKLDVDNKERLKIAILFLLQSYKVVMGSMLVVFVPRQCEGVNQTTICSVNENVQNYDTLNRVALCSNFITILFFMATYVVIKIQ